VPAPPAQKVRTLTEISDTQSHSLIRAEDGMAGFSAQTGEKSAPEARAWPGVKKPAAGTAA
jgi:hypothetical protein